MARRLRLIWWIPIVIAAAMAPAGCMKAKAATEPEMPALAPPPPPPRLIAPLEVEAQPLPIVETDETPTKQRPRPVRPTRPEQSRPTETRTDAGKTEQTDQPRDETAPESPQLRTQQPVDDATQERSIRELLSNASGDLGRVDYNALGVDARSQYDTAKRFIQQAYEALKTHNLVFAGNLADKAATLAAVLVGR